MSLFKTFGTNKNLEQYGVEITYPEAKHENGTIPVFIVKRAGGSNKDYDKALDRARRPFKADIVTNNLNGEQVNTVLVEAFLDSVLVGWKNLYDDNGKEISYSVEEARKLYEKIPDLFIDNSNGLLVRAANRTTFQDDRYLEELAKN